MLYPNCTFCLNGNESGAQKKCDGNCYFDVQEGQCKARDDFLLQNNVKIDESNKYGKHTQLNSAKMTCSNDNQCIGIYDDFCDNIGPFFLLKKGFVTSFSDPNCIHRRKKYEDPQMTCFDISMYKRSAEYEWSFGNCVSLRTWLGPGTYTQKCCTSEGKQFLTCSTISEAYDWSNSAVVLLGRRFCDDLVTYKSFVLINILELQSLLSNNEVQTIDEIRYEKKYARISSGTCVSYGMKIVQTAVECVTASRLLNLKAKLNQGSYTLPNSAYVLGEKGRYGCIYASNDELRFVSPSGYSKSSVPCGIQWFDGFSMDQYDCICEDPEKFIIDYSLDVNLIPRSSMNDCPKDSSFRARFGVCTCNDHCSWDLCRTAVAPNDCLKGTNSTWKWDHKQTAWESKYANLCSNYLY